jgi:GGDEF domain-containing protein
VLVSIEDITERNQAEEDVVARVGGDEFALILPAADMTAAEQALARIRRLVELNYKYYGPTVLSLAQHHAAEPGAAPGGRPHVRGEAAVPRSAGVN